MAASARQIRGTIVPTLRYHDVPAAIAWLCEAFGLEKHLVVTGQDGSVSYAQLAFGDGLVMLGSAEASVDGLMTQPDRTGGLETQICYLFVDDARAHYARAKAAGAVIVLDIDDETSSGRGYSCRDPEGHVWNFGTYDPRSRQSVHRAPAPTPRQRYAKRLALVVGNLANAMTAVAFLGWLYAVTERTLAYASVPADGAREEQVVQDLERSIRDTREQLMREKGAKEAAERSAKEIREQLAREKVAKEQAERLVAQIREQLVQERSKPATDPLVNELRAALQKAELAVAGNSKRLLELEQAAQKAREEAALERSGKAAAERAVADAKEQLARERIAREQADRAAKLAREQVKKPAPTSKPNPAPSTGLLWQ